MSLNKEHHEWFTSIRNEITNARISASTTVNNELLRLYASIGNSIIDVQERLGWGSQIIDNLAAHIKDEFPDNKGFSVRNLKYMRTFAEAYPQFPIVQVPLAPGSNEFVQVSLAQIPWYHHISLLTKVKDIHERAFYIIETAGNGWSRDAMLLQIKTDLYNRKGKAVTNFKETLPIEQSNLAQQTIKDPYVFDFLNITEDIKERDIENQLIDNVTKFLLELGK